MLSRLVETGTTDPNNTGRLCGRVTDLLSVLEHSKFALNVAFLRFVYEILPPSQIRELQECPESSVHIYLSPGRDGEEPAI